MVTDPALLDPLSVMLFPPASTKRPVKTPVSPEVFPPVLSPPENWAGTTGRFGPLIVSVMLPALVDPERVTLFPPASTSRPVTTPVSPEVLPPVESPPLNWAGTTGRFGPLMVRVRDPALLDPLRVMLLPPAKISLPVTAVVSPEVLPILESPPVNWAGTGGTV